MATTTYAITIGSNRPGRHGAPVAEVRAAARAIGAVVTSAVRITAPIGPSIRCFANAAALIVTDDTPPQVLVRLKRIERAFGRRRGRRWGARVIDLDLALWSGGAWRGGDLTIPHRALATRGFVLDPLAEIAPDWRIPGTGLTVRHLRAQLTKPVPLPRSRLCW